MDYYRSAELYLYITCTSKTLTKNSSRLPNVLRKKSYDSLFLILLISTRMLFSEIKDMFKVASFPYNRQQGKTTKDALEIYSCHSFK